MSEKILHPVIPSDPQKRLQWAMRELAKCQTTLAWVARANNLSPVGLRSAFFQPSFRAEKVIAEALQMTPEQLFPERYDDGLRIHPVRIRKTNTEARQGAVKKAMRA